MIGYAICGSFCTVQKSIKTLRSLVAEGNTVLPILNESVYTTDTRFGTAADTVKEVEKICSRPVLHTIVETEPIGPSLHLDMLVIAPCTGNTLAKIACGITDSAVTMAAKAQLRKNKPVVIALCSNDSLSGNLKNIGTLLNRKNIYFVPMIEDDPDRKPYSLVADFSLVKKAIAAAIGGKQLMPLFQNIK